MFISEFAQKVEVFQALVFFFSNGFLIEQLYIVQNFVFGIHLIVFSKGRMKGLNFHKSCFFQLNLRIALCWRIEHIVVNGIGFCTDTVYAANALHESGGVPRGIVVYDYVGAMEVYAFGQYFGSNDDVVFVALLLGIPICIKVAYDGFIAVFPVFGWDGQYIFSLFVL